MPEFSSALCARLFILCSRVRCVHGCSRILVFSSALCAQLLMWIWVVLVILCLFYLLGIKSNFLSQATPKGLSKGRLDSIFLIYREYIFHRLTLFKAKLTVDSQTMLDRFDFPLIYFLFIYYYFFNSYYYDYHYYYYYYYYCY